MANDFCEPGTPGYPKWTAVDAILWKLKYFASGKNTLLFRYKDAWIIYNRDRIATAATRHHIPKILLASIAWSEAGGMPDDIDSIAFPVRSLLWNDKWWFGHPPKAGKPPIKTSFGAISMQVSVAVGEMGLKADELSAREWEDIISCLETNSFNIEIVAKHLRGLIQHDFPSIDSKNLTDDQFLIAASRYNRGTARRLEDYVNSLHAPKGSPERSYTEYGRAALKHRDHVRSLL